MTAFTQWQDFNPRSREGSDGWGKVLDYIGVISIHAPAKGATQTVNSATRDLLISIHAPAKGATRTGCCTGWNSWGFQSTLPRRERRNWTSLRGQKRSISIHAPAKGATYCYCNLGFYALISIHAPAKGATVFINIFSLAVRLFFISSHQ